MLYWCIIIIIIIEIYFSCPSSLNLVFSLRQIWKHKTKPKLIFFNFHAAAETWSLPIDESFHIIEPNYLITKKFIVRFLLIGNEFSLKCVECCLETVFFFFELLQNIIINMRFQMIHVSWDYEYLTWRSVIFPFAFWLPGYC